MTIAVDWDVKPQPNKGLKNHVFAYIMLQYCFKSILPHIENNSSLVEEVLMLYPLVSSAYNLCKQFGPRLDTTKCWE